MNRKVIYGLVVLGLAVLVMLLNRGGAATVDLGFTELRAARAIIYFGFTAVGVIVGLLIK